MTTSSPATVLIVEDEPLILEDTSEMVEDDGYVVLQASNADEAFKLLEANSNIDVIMTDIEMRGVVDGLELARTVRERWPHISIIIVSGRVHPEARQLPTGSKFFGKPFVRSAVLKALRQGAVSAAEARP